MTCWKPASPPSTRTPARRWPRTGPTWSPFPAPAPRHHRAAPTPRPPGGTATPTCPAPKARCSSATTSRRHHDPRRDGPPVPELTRRITLSSCHADPVRVLTPVAHPHARGRHPPRRRPRRLRLRPPRPGRLGPPAPRRRRAAGPGPAPARPRPPGHPPRRDHRQRQPRTAPPPRPLLHLGPLPPGATADQIAAHDQQTAELARHKLGRLTADDADGYHRVTCPAATGKLRCPLRPASMTLTTSRPEILTPPEHPPACCTQQTLTVPPDSRPRPGKNTTTPRRRTGAPTPGAPPPNEASPPSKTRPPTPSPAAGAASWA